MDQDELLKAPIVQTWSEVQLQEVRAAYPTWDPEWETIEEHLIQFQEEAQTNLELSHENQEEIYLDGEIQNTDETEGALLEQKVAGQTGEVLPTGGFPDSGF